MVLNRQRRVAVRVNDLEQFLARARRALGLAPDSLTVCLVTNAEIARWNRTYRGKAVPTDVLSFPTEARSAPGGKPRKSAGDQAYLGDIAIAPAVARENADRLGRSFENEMRILILHGMLHLMGYDHETDTGQMECREQQLRCALGLG